MSSRPRTLRALAPPAPVVDALARRAALAASEKKAYDILLLDLRGLTDATDFFVIASGSSDTQVRAIAENITEAVERAGGGSPWHVEGMGPGRWVLLDYVDFVVHVFHHETRLYYQLERLWGDAATVDWNERG